VRPNRKRAGDDQEARGDDEGFRQRNTGDDGEDAELHVQNRKLVRCVKGIRHELRALEPLKLKPGLGSIVEADLGRLQA
jgi:hypothetical protein